MTEIDVTLTDYILCIESFIFAMLVIKHPASYKLKKPYFILFLGFSLSSLIGGTVHGFFDHPSPFYSLLWQATLICIGISAYGFALSGIGLGFNNNQKYKNLLKGLFFFYVVGTFFYKSFLMAIIFYLPSTILTLIGFVKAFRKSKDKNIRIGIWGLYLSLIAPIIQQCKFSLHPVYLTYNAVYHIIIMAALYLFFIGVTGVLNTNLGDKNEL